MNSSAAIPPQSAELPAYRAVASPWHTALLLSIFLCVSFLGAHYGNRPGFSAYGRPPRYALAITMEWVLLALTWYGMRRRGVHLGDLMGHRWRGLFDAFRDLAIGVTSLFFIDVMIVAPLSVWLKVGRNLPRREMLPQTHTDIILWCLLSLSAGFCEELMFRGYLQRQFTALTRSVIGGMVLQGIVFGASHGYQGWKRMLILAVWGTLLGALARWRQSLRPGIIAHSVQDALFDLLARHFVG